MKYAGTGNDSFREVVNPGITEPEPFVEHVKRFIGSSKKHWEIDGVLYMPVDISAIILAQLIADDRARTGLSVVAACLNRRARSPTKPSSRGQCQRDSFALRS